MEFGLRSFFMICLGLLLGLLPQHSEAPSPPESYSLQELKPGESLVDPKFEQWLQEVYSYPVTLDMKDKDYQEYAAALHPTEKLLLDAKRVSRLRRSKRKQAVDNIVTIIRDDRQRNQLKEHILYPDLINAVLETNRVADPLVGFLEEEIAASSGYICPLKHSILRRLDLENKEILPAADILSFLKMISHFHSERFKERSLERLMEMVDEEKHQNIKDTLVEALKPFPRLVADHSWLFKDQINQEVKKLDKPLEYFDKAEDAITRHHCNTAKKRLVRGIKTDDDKKYLPQVEAISYKVESCFRRKGNRARLRYLSRIEKYLKNQYGFKGREIVLRRKALIYWSQDHFEKTRHILATILKNATTSNDQEILGRTLYTSARVDENEGKLDRSIVGYETFVREFPHSDKVGEAITSLVMIHTLKHNYVTALGFAEQLVRMETVKKVNERDSGLLSLALFWSGKLNLHLGNQERTREYWRRLASEFYSTFYGAIGHYMLEALLGKRLVLQPSRVPSFDKESIIKVFDARGMKTLQRIENLLNLGLNRDAFCETKELGGSPDDYRKNLVKAMYLYASGEWLESIKKFVKLPRSLRHSLPRGMEKLLFPKAFTPIVNHYAKRLGVDPAYVFAIIRQESVFNPNARSAVGATGLMQLMPATARLEARSLQRGYVAKEHRRNLIRRSRKKSRLYDAETNLALGIHHVYRLFNRYKNPIYVLTSYNANPRATEKWLENLGTNDALAFVERIPYRETRAYVKLVMRNYFYYKRWYEEPGVSPFMDFLAPKSIELARAANSNEASKN